MGMFGRGISFGNQFMPRPAIRFRGGPMIGGGGGPISFNFHERIVLKQCSPNFWSTVSDFFNSFFMTRMTLGCFGGFGGFGGGISQSTNATTEKKTNDLEDLKTLYKAKNVNIVERNGKFTATDKDGNIIGSDLSFDEMSEALSKYNKTPTVEGSPEKEKTEAEKKADKAKELGLTLKDGKYMKDGVEYEWDGTTFKKKETVDVGDEGEGGKDDGNVRAAEGGSRSSRSQGGSGTGHKNKVKAGWYRASEQTQGDGQYLMKKGTIREGMTAKQVTDIILNNKVNYLSTEDRKLLAQEIADQNPSVFEDGKVKQGADLKKLDIPTIKYIKEHYVTSGGTPVHKGTGSYTSKNNNSNNITKTVTSKTGRYAKQENGKWHYYAKDGTELKEDHIQRNDKDLWQKTHPSQSNVTMTDRNFYNGNGYGA